MPSLTANARKQACWLWQSMQNHQMVLWYDNWVKKNYGVDPLHLDQCGVHEDIGGCHGHMAALALSNARLYSQ